LQSSANYAQSLGGYKSLFVGTANEPAVTSANVILQTIISPPFTWNWNRASASFVTTAGIQDYLVYMPTFGFIEKASYTPAASITNTSLTSNVATYLAVNNFTAGNTVTVTGTQNGTGGVFNVINQPILAATGTQFTVAITSGNVSASTDFGTAISGNVTEIPNVQNILGTGTESGTPNFIAPQIDDNRGNITFRTLPLPNATYQINIIFQKRIPALMTGPTSTWAPIPDHYSVLYQWGFAALILAYFGDARWASFSQKFFAALLGMAEGLEESQKETFEAAWLDMVAERQSMGMKTQQGVQSRSI
jgi:hypothetical protein